MLAFRKQHADTLVFGDFEPLDLDDTPVFAYWRKDVEAQDGKDVLVLLNMTAGQDVSLVLPGDGSYTALATTSVGVKGAGDSSSGQSITLSAYEGLVLQYTA